MAPLFEGDTVYSGDAACGGTYNNTGHTLTYTANNNTITESCSDCNQHTASAVISANNAVYNGSASETASVTYSSNWLGGELTIVYANNTNSGTATASITKENVTATASFTISNASQTAPNVSGEDETVRGKADGKITGVTAAMEYRIKGTDTYTKVTAEQAAAGKVTDLVAGTYYVRLAAKSNYDASSDKEVVIDAGHPLTVTMTSGTGYTLTPVTSTNEVSYDGSYVFTLSGAVISATPATVIAIFSVMFAMVNCPSCSVGVTGELFTKIWKSSVLL